MKLFASLSQKTNNNNKNKANDELNHGQIEHPSLDPHGEGALYVQTLNLGTSYKTDRFCHFHISSCMTELFVFWKELKFRGHLVMSITAGMAQWLRALASHQCGRSGSIPGLGVICGLSLLLVLVPALRVFLRVLRFSSLLKKPTFLNPNSTWNARSPLQRAP